MPYVEGFEGRPRGMANLAQVVAFLDDRPTNTLDQNLENMIVLYCETTVTPHVSLADTV